MASTHYNYRNYGSRGPVSRRNNEFEGDMAVYMRSIAPDNDEVLERLRRNLRLARRQELTPRQAQVLDLYFDRNMTMEQVGRELGITKSTVSRTVTRAKNRLKRCLRYGF